MKKKKVIIAMSGGVDSSVSAWLLKKKYDVEGLFMKNWEGNDKKNFCSYKKDIEDVKNVCNIINIPFHKINFSIEYWEKVFKKFLHELKKGNTPNPDILCNKEIKFNTFLEFSTKKLKADFIATGHYAKLTCINGDFFLKKGTDKEKDQSYFLYTLKKKQLKKILFPIGNMKKEKVRLIARKLKMPTANKKDSTGICFIGPKNFQKFLKKYIPTKIGKIFTISGKFIGKHNGFHNYTLGQRRKIGNIKKNNEIDCSPIYIVKKNIKKNVLIVSRGFNNPYLMSKGMLIYKINFLVKININQNFFCSVKIRHQKKVFNCLTKLENKNLLRVIFEYPISSITPGQSAVFYIYNICLGGGIILKQIPLVKFY
ncbi:tRNA 2-thiouridine(34) synthase MnmA [Buchnera aphidicola (Pseudoregma panicola)]|uniref:tRNA 2-thiouridine(34) synthase MnmA n=1 Tax=Buchnera aphidicola TaxID=9 RepID=UPI0031B6B574